MIEIYKDGWRHFRTNFALIVLIAIVLESARVTVDLWGMSQSSLVVPQIIVLMFFHQIVLFGGKLSLFGKSPNQPPFGHFIWASLMLLIGAVIVATIFVVLIGASFVVWVLAFLLMYFVVLVLLGTSLPAAAAKDRYNPKISFARGKKTWPAVMGGLLAGPVVVGLILLGAQVFLTRALGLNETGYVSLGTLDPVDLIYNTASQIAGFFTSMLAVVVLCRAYLRVAPSEVLEQVARARQSAV